MRQHLDMRIETAAIYCLFTVLSQKWNDLWNGVLLIAYDISTALKLSRKYFIRKESDKKMDIISLIAKHVHAVKTEFRQFARPLRGIGAIHFF